MTAIASDETGNKKAKTIILQADTAELKAAWMNAVSLTRLFLFKLFQI